MSVRTMIIFTVIVSLIVGCNREPTNVTKAENLDTTAKVQTNDDKVKIDKDSLVPGVIEIDNVILSKVLSKIVYDDTITIVSPNSCNVDYFNPTNRWINDYYFYYDKSLKDGFGLNAKAIFTRMLRALVDKNKRARRYTTHTFTGTGFIVDTNYEYTNFFSETGLGWEKLHEMHPKVSRYSRISLPVFDVSTGMVLVYVEHVFFVSGYCTGPKGAYENEWYEEGRLLIYMYENDELIEVCDEYLWNN